MGEFDQPVQDAKISKKQFVESIIQGNLPSKVNLNFINLMFESLNPLIENNDKLTIGMGTFTILATWQSKFNLKSNFTATIGFEKFCELLSEKMLQVDIAYLV